MRRLNAKQKDFFVGWMASALSMNLVGIVRAIVAWPLELMWGLSLFNMLGFRLFSLGLDFVLAAPFWIMREGLYGLRFANRKNSWHKFSLDTMSFSISKSLSYIFSLWLMTNLPPEIFARLIWINVFLLVTTGAFNCWHIDVMKKQLPDLTRRLIAWREAKEEA